MLRITTKINRRQGEYIELMKVLTETAMNLLEIVNLSDERFEEVYIGCIVLPIHMDLVMFC